MDQTTRQTALFFGFLAAAMAQVSAQQAAAKSAGGETPPAIQRSAGDVGRAAPGEAATRAIAATPRPGNGAGARK